MHHFKVHEDALAKKCTFICTTEVYVEHLCLAFLLAYLTELPVLEFEPLSAAPLWKESLFP